MRSDQPVWSPAVSLTWEAVRCPVCGQTADLYRWQDVARLPVHTGRDGTHCDGSTKTMQAARELSALRQRAHP